MRYIPPVDTYRNVRIYCRYSRAFDQYYFVCCADFADFAGIHNSIDAARAAIDHKLGR